MRHIERDELQELARANHFTFAEEELDDYHDLTEYVFGALDYLESQPAPPPDNVEAERDPGRRPGPGEDPYNAIVRWCRVKAGAEGILSGKRIALKDSMAIAGVPMTCGSRLLADYVPAQDSTVAERVLRAGGEIVAVTNMDYLAFTAAGDTSDYGPTLNPFDPTRSAGGSSGGAAAGLHYDSIDIALGGDQGGSIRLPAAWCGIVGLKPTHSLVPYTGIVGIDQTFDHAGPMGRTVADVALLLQAVAGKDPGDPRQREVPDLDFVGAVAHAGDDLKGVRVGLLAEGFEGAGCDRATLDAVGEAVERLRALGADVRRMSVPEHAHGAGIAFAGYLEGFRALVDGGGNGFHWAGRWAPDLAEALNKALKERAQGHSPQIKLVLLGGTYMQRSYGGSAYVKAQSLRAWQRAGYDRALAEVDALLTPTAPWVAHVHDPSLPLPARVKRGWDNLPNTIPLDMTGHPALSIPAAEADGLPVGVQLIGRRFGDAELLALARTYEQAYGWLPERPR